MINQLLKLGALVAIGRFLKPRVSGLLWVAAAWLALWFVHGEFVSYVQLSGDTRYVLHATLLKTTLYALSIGIYVLRVERRLWPRPVAIPPVVGTTSTPTARVAPKPVPRATQQPAPGDDGFDFLRDKPTLKK